jgi:hypothetical protein
MSMAKTRLSRCTQLMGAKGLSPSTVRCVRCGTMRSRCLKFGASFLYVVELDENSWFVTTLPSPQPLAGGTISACDVTVPTCVEVSAGIPLPTAITFGKDGTLWSTEFGPVPGLTTVVKVN